MYAKSMIEYARARALDGKWSQLVNVVPVVLALAVATLPFTLEQQFVKSLSTSVPNSLDTPRSNPISALQQKFEGLVYASVVTAPKREVMPLDAQQRAVANYISRKYGVATDIVQELVRTAFASGKQFGVDPLLVVAIMAVESSFNPIAESTAGAKGLMQIIPKYHPEKFADFGGEHAVFDPRVNIFVGARIVREYLQMASGNLFTAMQTYAGALADPDAIYTNRVLNEKDQLDALAGFPKTDRSNRIVVPVESMRPGSLVIPPVPLPAPGAVVPLPPASAAEAPPLRTIPSNKPAEEVQHMLPAQPLLPLLPLLPVQPAVNVSLLLPESAQNF